MLVRVWFALAGAAPIVVSRCRLHGLGQPASLQRQEEARRGTLELAQTVVQVLHHADELLVVRSGILCSGSLLLGLLHGRVRGAAADPHVELAGGGQCLSCLGLDPLHTGGHGMLENDA